MQVLGVSVRAYVSLGHIRLAIRPIAVKGARFRAPLLAIRPNDVMRDTCGEKQKNTANMRCFFEIRYQSQYQYLLAVSALSIIILYFLPFSILASLALTGLTWMI